MTARRIALLIGNGAYPREPELAALAGPANDVRHLAEVLGSPTAGAFDEVKTFVDREHHAIAPELEETLAEAGHDALVLIYYSGHGKLNSRGQLCLATVNTRLSQLHSTSLPLPTLKTLIDESRCRQVLLILDCCFSGAAGKAFLRGTVDDQLLLSAQDSSGLHILSSSTGLEVSREREHEDGGEVMGNFTRCMVEGMRSGAADLNGDGVVTLSELREYVGRNLRGQSPRYWGIEAGGDPPVARNAGVVRARQEREAAERRRTAAAQKRLTDWLRAGQLPADVYSRALDCLDPPDDGAEAPLARDRLLELIEGPAASPRHLATAFRAIGGDVAEGGPVEPAPVEPRAPAPAARAPEAPPETSVRPAPTPGPKAAEPVPVEPRPPAPAARAPESPSATSARPAPTPGAKAAEPAPVEPASSPNSTARLLEEYNRATSSTRTPWVPEQPPATGTRSALGSARDGSAAASGTRADERLEASTPLPEWMKGGGPPAGSRIHTAAPHHPAASEAADKQATVRESKIMLYVSGAGIVLVVAAAILSAVPDYEEADAVSADTAIVTGTDTIWEPTVVPTTDSVVTTTTMPTDTTAGYAYPGDTGGTDSISAH